MKLPIFIENSKIPTFISKFTPINVWAITLGPLVICKGTLTPRVKNHETIHYHQYKETYFLGFILLYLYDYFYSAIFKKMGFTSKAYKNIRFEQEAYSNDQNLDYLNSRQKNNWKNYKL